MGQLLQRFLIGAGIFVATLAVFAAAPKFYPDDPLLREPKPRPVGKLARVSLTDTGDFLRNTFLHQGEKRLKGVQTPALDTNTIDEVPDSPWYTSRHYFHPLTIDALKAGPGGHEPPSMDRPWFVYEAKSEGITPGLRIVDSAGRKYLLKFDPPSNIELSTAPDVIVAHLFYALGYNVPDNYPVRFRRDQITVQERVGFRRLGRAVDMDKGDLDHVLKAVPQYPDGTYRAVASRLVEGEILGPFQFFGTRPDDPNDIVPHERRRVLRGLHVFSAWVEHTDSRAVNTLDTIEGIDGVRAVRHYLIDFGAALGSDTVMPHEPWHGHQYFVDVPEGLKSMATAGLYSPRWERVQTRSTPSGGRFTSMSFDPGAWKPSYPNPAFENRTPQDCFWAAKQVMSFTDEQIRAIVAAGQYSDAATAESVARVLMERRDLIGKHYFSQVLPLDQYRVDNGELKFRNLGGNGKYSVSWWTFDNDTRAVAAISGDSSFRVPDRPGYLRAELSDGNHKTFVYVRNREVVGVER